MSKKMTIEGNEATFRMSVKGGNLPDNFEVFIDTVIDYTDDGRLVGHINLIDEHICRRARSMAAFPEKLLTKLRHMILSHHGELEFASPVVPMMPEAFVLYYCDEIDSKMGAIDRIRHR